MYENYKKQLDEILNQYHSKNAICYLKEDGSRLMLTYGQIKGAVFQIGRTLADIPLCPSDRVAVLSPHTPFAALLIVALSYLGYTAVPLDVSLPTDEVTRLLTHVEASAIFMDSKSYSTFGQVTGKIPVLEIGHDFTCSLRSPGKMACKDISDGSRDIAVIIFSSGTTGSMKGIEVTYKALLYSFNYLVRYTNLNEEATYLDVLPINHIVGYSVLISCFLKGCEVGFLENTTPQGLSQGFLEYKPTNFIMIPKVYEIIQEKILAAIRKKPLFLRCYAYSAMRICGAIRRLTGIKLRFLTKPIWSAALGPNMKICGCGAAPCRQETARFYLNLGIDFVNVYGSTEACFPITAANCNERYPVNGTGNISQFSEIQIRIFQPDSKGVGEIRVKTPMIMKGYFKDPELTAASFDEDGYFKTGDLGVIDRQNRLHVTGRIKETILLQTGKKVSPSDIDAYYSRLCGETRIASCGIGGPNGFDTIHLFIETHGQSRMAVEEARSRILEQSAAAGSLYQISAIHEIEQFPLTSIGKVKRFILKEAVEKSEPVQSAEKVQPERDGGVYDAICRLILSATKGMGIVEPGSRLQEDLGLDSLNVFELCVELEEKYAVSIEPYLHQGITVGEIAAFIEEGVPESDSKAATLEQYPLEKTEKDMKAYRRFMAYSGKMWRIEVSGRENIRPGEKYIFCPNHESYLDGLWIIGSLDEEIRRTTCTFAADHLFRHKVFRRGLVLLGGIPVQRGGNTAPAVKRARECLASGDRNLLLHPEGTRTRNGELGAFKKGAARLSLETGVSILPVCINGAYEIFPPHRKLPRLFDWKHFRRYPMQIRFGTPVSPGGNTAEEITGEIRRQIVSMKHIFQYE